MAIAKVQCKECGKKFIADDNKDMFCSEKCLNNYNRMTEYKGKVK